MAIDIHCFIEQRNKETNRWEAILYEDNTLVRIWDGCRNRELFRMLADTPCNIFPIAFDGSLVPLRGVPYDVSDAVLNEYYDQKDDGYNIGCETWYGYCELDAYSYTLSMMKEALEDAKGDEDDSGLGVIDMLKNFVDEIRDMLDKEVMPNEVRVIMWFDN